MSLSIFGTPVKSDLAEQCLECIRNANIRHATYFKANAKAEVSWHASTRAWMTNTRLFTKAVTESVYFNRADADPLWFCPMASTAKHLPEWRATGGDTPPVSAFLHGPTRDSIMRWSFTISIWSRQWSEELRFATLYCFNLWKRW